jgi:hypothetical protein
LKPRPTDEDREREPFRWCVFCDADCHEDDPEHADDCPSITGIFPVRLHKHCDSCTCNGTIRCMDCGAELKVGDFYMHREIEGTDFMAVSPFAGAAVSEVICMGCKAHDELPTNQEAP